MSRVHQIISLHFYCLVFCDECKKNVYFFCISVSLWLFVCVGSHKANLNPSLFHCSACIKPVKGAVMYMCSILPASTIFLLDFRISSDVWYFFSFYCATLFIRIVVFVMFHLTEIFLMFILT